MRHMLLKERRTNVKTVEKIRHRKPRMEKPRAEKPRKAWAVARAAKRYVAR